MAWHRLLVGVLRGGRHVPVGVPYVGLTRMAHPGSAALQDLLAFPGRVRNREAPGVGGPARTSVPRCGRRSVSLLWLPASRGSTMARCASGPARVYGDWCGLATIAAPEIRRERLEERGVGSGGWGTGGRMEEPKNLDGRRAAILTPILHPSSPIPLFNRRSAPHCGVGTGETCGLAVRCARSEMVVGSGWCAARAAA